MIYNYFNHNEIGANLMQKYLAKSDIRAFYFQFFSIKYQKYL